MEDEEREAPAISRNQNVIHTLPRDEASVGQVLAPLLERVDEGLAETQLLVITADAEAAVAIGATIVGLAGERKLRVLPVTSVRRAQRLMKERPAHIVAGAPAQLLAMVQGASVKLDRVNGLVFAWAGDIIASGASSELEAVLGEVPKDAARALVATHATPAVEALVERYLRRGRRTGAPVEGEDGPGVALQYVTVGALNRAGTLRRLLDELDPAAAGVYVRSPESAAEAERALAALGYGGDGASVRVTRGGVTGEALVVLYDVPASREELRQAAGEGNRQVVALARPLQLALLRMLAGGAPVTPLVLPGAAVTARSREERMRAELRDALAGGAPARELLALEPLLDEFDGVELAAAALRLLEQARSGAPATGHAAPAAAGTPGGQWRRLFMSVGARDNVRPGDLVGSIAGEAGISSDQIGKIDLRDNHALVEIVASVAEAVAAKMTGTMVRGRRIIARLEEERPARPARPAGDRPPRRDFSDRPPKRDFGDRPRPRDGEARPRPGAPRGGRPRDRE